MIQTIKDAHDDNIKGFIELKNGSIISCSYKVMKIWNFKVKIKNYLNY